MEKYKHTILWPATFVVTVLLVISCTTPEERAEKALDSYLKKSGTTGLSVAVVKENQIVYSGAFGKSSIEKNTDLKSDDIFRIASISKSFTTTAILTLVEKGLVSPDQDVSDIIGFAIRNPKFPEVPITVKMLLSHTSSLNDEKGYFSLNTVNPDINPNFAESYNDYMPGTAYQYCNLGFNMLGCIVEKVSGVRFDVYVKNAILDPLKLNASFNVDDFRDVTFVSLYTPELDTASGKTDFIPAENAYMSQAASLDPAKYVAGYSTPVFSPTGGMKISASGLARYMIMHINHGFFPETGARIISDESSKLMQSPVIETAVDNYYCLGLTRTSTLIPGEVMTGHTGSAYGLYSAMYFEPAKKFGIVMIANGTTPEYGNYVEGFAPVQRDVVNMLYDIFIK